MAYLGLDKSKLMEVIALAMSSKDLHDFFRLNRNELMLNGAKLRNLPVGKDLMPTFIELPQSVDPVIKKWFLKSGEVNTPEPVLAVIAFFHYISLNQHTIKQQVRQNKELRKYATSVLTYLSMDNPPSELIDYFSTPHEAPQNSSIDDGKSQAEIAINDGIHEIFAALVADEEPTDLKEKRQLIIDLYYAIQSLLFFKSSRHDDANQCLSHISSTCSLKDILRKAIDETAINTPAHAQLYIEDELDYDNFGIIAQCQYVAAGQKCAFLSPLAAISSSNEIFDFKSETLKNLFPEDGRMIVFPSQKSSWLPVYQEMAIWQAERQDTDKPVKTKATIDKTKSLHPLYFIDSPPNKTDQIREQIKSLLRDHTQTRVPPIFCLNKELYVSIGSSQSLTSIDNNALYRDMRAWKNLPNIVINDKNYIIGPLPDADSTYTCAPLSFIFSVLLKTTQDVISLGLTKKQVQILGDLLPSRSDEDNLSDINYIRSGVNKIVDLPEEFDQLINELMQTPSIQSRIEALIQETRNIEMAKTADIQSEIFALQERREELLGQIEQNRIELKSVPDKIVDAIQKRFHKAKSDAIQELADIALYQAFFSSNESNPVNTTKNFREPIIRSIDMTKTDDSTNHLPLLGLSRKKISALKKCCEISRQVGLMLAIKGIGARLIVEELAQLTDNSNSAIIEMEIGVLACSQLDTILRTGRDLPHTLAIIDANLSALDIYGRSLLDFILKRIATSALPGSGILLSLSESHISLPIPLHFLQNMILLDVDNFNENGSSIGSTSYEIKEALLDKDDGILSDIFWPPAADRLREYISNIADDNEDDLYCIATIMEHQTIIDHRYKRSLNDKS